MQSRVGVSAKVTHSNRPNRMIYNSQTKAAMHKHTFSTWHWFAEHLAIPRGDYTLHLCSWDSVHSVQGQTHRYVQVQHCLTAKSVVEVETNFVSNISNFVFNSDASTVFRKQCLLCDQDFVDKPSSAQPLINGARWKEGHLHSIGVSSSLHLIDSKWQWWRQQGPRGDDSGKVQLFKLTHRYHTRIQIQIQGRW